MPAKAPWFALLLAMALALSCAPAFAGAGEHCVVLSAPAVLRDQAGRELGRAPAYSAWPLLKKEGGRLMLAWRPKPGAPARRAWLPAGAGAVLPGSPADHAKRLARLAAANLPAGIKARLAAGRIEPGDTMRKVEMAWGMPQRSFMVNYINDEQHYVYFRPDGGKVLLRFKGGLLAGPPPPPLESPQPPR